MSVIDIARPASPVRHRQATAAPPALTADPDWRLSGMRRVTLADGAVLTDGGGPRWLLVLEGAVRLETATRTDPLAAGDAALVAACTAHRVVAAGRAVVVAAALHATDRHGLPSPFVVRGFATRHAGIAALVRACPLDDDGCARPALFSASYAGLLGAALTASWLDERRPGDPAAVPEGERDPVVAAVLAAVHASPGEPWTTERMARAVHLSRSALGERFRRTLGRGPVEVLREARMRAARQLLRDPARPVEHVAHAVGYGSTAAFSRAFSAHHGLGPQAWRRGSGAGSAHDGEGDPRRDGRGGPGEQGGRQAVPVQERAS
ncbi:helix-turn-helix transcriptional regulator [Isoptericola sp. BMS4]|uniref:helix-turn-helix transcriptional regulator n=1 Tax=Isoptericola sp. BMS4 TaxID=2527875 RepID=UPI0014207ACD|nr:helix-turn-helix transcriptional regulator [Isoptericola sp. BMS4]